MPAKDEISTPAGGTQAGDDLERLEESEAARALAEQRAQDLEAQLREARESSERTSAELESVRESLLRVSDPELRLRAGMELFNSSEHARTVASISKSLGLPKVHAGMGGDGVSGKPTFTFVWEEMGWRRYVSDPTEGVEEPRVYLVGNGDETPQQQGQEYEPNARMDARGRLTLGIQAR
ncbi:MAG: hypothetical protein H0U04_08675 [Rubrobacter sp.]|nr:hypothetical protein [Rubrobacter sp.]